MAALAKQSFSLRNFLFGSTPYAWESSPFAAVGLLAEKRREFEAQRAKVSAMSVVPLIGFAGAQLARRIGADAVAKDVIGFFRDNLVAPVRRTFAFGRDRIETKDRLTGASPPLAAANSAVQSIVREAATRGRDPVADNLATERAAALLDYRSKLSTLLHGLPKDGPGPFRDWDDVAWSISGRMPGRAVVVRKGDSFIGTQVATCASTPDESRAAMREIRARLEKSQESLPPAQRRPINFLFNEGMPPGSPILVADGTLVKASGVSPHLDAGRLSATFSNRATSDLSRGNARLAEATRRRDVSGVRAAEQEIELAREAQARVSFSDNFAAKATRSRAARDPFTAPKTGTIDLAKFRAQAAERGPQPAAPARTAAPGIAPAPAGPAFGGVELKKAKAAMSISQANTVVQIGDAGEVSFYHTGMRRELKEVLDARQLPEGKYAKEQFGMPMGFLAVSSEGSLTHLDQAGRPHRTDGPFFEPAPGSSDRPRWALEGNELSGGAFQAEMRHRRQSEAMPGAGFGQEPGEGFGGTKSEAPREFARA